MKTLTLEKESTTYNIRLQLFGLATLLSDEISNNHKTWIVKVDKLKTIFFLQKFGVRGTEIYSEEEKFKWVNLEQLSSVCNFNIDDAFYKTLKTKQQILDKEQESQLSGHKCQYYSFDTFESYLQFYLSWSI